MLYVIANNDLYDISLSMFHSWLCTSTFTKCKSLINVNFFTNIHFMHHKKRKIVLIWNSFTFCRRKPFYYLVVVAMSCIINWWMGFCQILHGTIKMLNMTFNNETICMWSIILEQHFFLEMVWNSMEIWIIYQVMFW